MKKTFLTVVLLLACASLLRAQTIPGLGHVTFPTSTQSAVAQSDFIRGLLLLHLFEYEDAVKSFVAAENADPGFAMAYWGEAMTFNHPVWNQVNVRAGRAALEKFGATAEERAGRIADLRERAYMSAVEILYSRNGDKRERDAQYAAAMQQLAEAYPKDDEAQLFYALALLGTSEGVRDVPTYLRAAEIAKSVFARDPQNPGLRTIGFMGWTIRNMPQARLSRRARCPRSRRMPGTRSICVRTFLWRWECGTTWSRPTSPRSVW